RDREVANDEPEPVAHPRLHLLDDRIRGTAVGTFVVAVLDERHRRVSRPLDMVPAFVDRHRECGLPLGRAHESPSFPRSSSAWRMALAPGFNPTGETSLQWTTPCPPWRKRA